MKRAIGFTVLYGLVGLLSYFLFLYLTFPSEVARDRIVYEAHEAGIRLQLEDVKPSFPLGFNLTNVDIYGAEDKRALARKRRSRMSRPKKVKEPDVEVEAEGDAAKGGADDGEGQSQAEEADDGEKAEAPEPTPTPEVEVPVLTLDSLQIDSILPLLPGGAELANLSLSASLYGGELEGSYGLSGDEAILVGSLEDLDLSRYSIRGEDFDIHATGKIGLEADLKINKDKIRDSSGTVHLSVENLVLLKSSKIQGFDLPVQLAFKSREGNLEVKNGRIELDEFTLESVPLSIVIDGSITLNADPMRSRFNLKVAFKFGEELKVIAAFLPDSARSDDEYYHYALTGPITNLRHRPDRLAARRSGRDSSSRAKSRRDRLRRPGLSGGPTDFAEMRKDTAGPRRRAPVLDDAERERLREERRRRAEERRKRREELRKRRMEATGGAFPGPRTRRRVLSEDDDEAAAPDRPVFAPSENFEDQLPEGIDGGEFEAPMDPMEFMPGWEEPSE